MEFIDVIKSRFDKNYVLTNKSPQHLKSNIELIKRTINKNSEYIFDVDGNLIEQELNKYNRGEDSLITYLLTRFKKDFFYTDIAPFYGSSSKKFWLDNYANMTETGANTFIKNFIQYEELQKDEDFIKIAIEVIKNNEINPNGLYGPKLAKIFKDNELYSNYVCKYFIDKNINLSNVNFEILNNINIFGFCNEMIHKYSLDECIKYNLINQNNVEDIISKIAEENSSLSVDEIVGIIKSNFGEQICEKCFQKFNDNKIFSLYLKYNGETLKGATFDDLNIEFNAIPTEDLETILRSRYPLQEDSRASFIDILKSFDEAKRNLLISTIQVQTRKSDNWFNYVNNIIYNLYGNSFDKLINDVITRSNEITTNDLESMAKIFSKHHGVFANQCNIETLEELRSYDQIRNNCTNYLISTNGLVSDEKVFDNYRNINQITRLKDAYFNKYFNITYQETIGILNSFANIVNQKSDYFNEELIQAFKDIRNIFDADSIDKLNTLSSSITPYEGQNIFEDMLNYYNELYSEKGKKPLESDIADEKVSTTGKIVEIYESTGEYDGLIKIVANDAKDAKKKWHNSMRPEGGYRYSTCVSFANQAKFEFENDLLVGFDLGKKSAIRLTSAIDAHTPDLWDTLGYEYGEESQFLSPDEIRGSYNSTGHNELVLNTLYGGEKLEPSYVISLHDVVTQTEIDFASEFDIPVIHIPKERVKTFESNRLTELNDKFKGKNLSTLEERLEYNQFVLDYRRFKANFGDQELIGIIDEKNMEFVEVPEVIQSKIANNDISLIINKNETLTDNVMHR